MPAARRVVAVAVFDYNELPSLLYSHIAVPEKCRAQYCPGSSLEAPRGTSLAHHSHWRRSCWCYMVEAELECMGIDQQAAVGSATAEVVEAARELAMVAEEVQSYVDRASTAGSGECRSRSSWLRLTLIIEVGSGLDLGRRGRCTAPFILW